MSALEVLRDHLMALPAEAVKLPAMPVASLHQEADNLLTWLGQGAFAKLAAVGVPAGALDDARAALEASREAQAAWLVAWGGRKGVDRKEAEAAGDALRGDLVAACRWNLRADADAQASLSRIVEGEGLADLVQDLYDLAALITAKADAFAPDATFDPGERAAAARASAEAISAGLATAFSEGEKAAAKDLRDRATSWLSSQLSALRAAGTYRFRGTDDVRRFQSQYRRRSRTRAAGGDPLEMDAPVDA